MEFTTHLELHSQATRLKGKLNPQSDDNHTGLSPSMGNWSRIPTDLGCTTNCRKWASQTPHSQTSITNEGFSAGLFPFRSPLLGESFLVSFPPLNDMLKFSGWPCPIWGLIKFKFYIPLPEDFLPNSNMCENEVSRDFAEIADKTNTHNVTK